MKRQFGVFLILGLLLIPTISNGNPFVFEVKPGLGIQSANFGYQMGKMIPYIGLNLIAIGADGTFTETDFNSSMGSTYERVEITDISGSATLLIPHIGLKYHFSDPAAAIRPYCVGGVFKSIPIVSVEGDETTRYYEDGVLTDVYNDNTQLEDEEEDAIKDLLGVWGFNVGFGVEYPFSEHFSIGGEFGLRLFFASANYDYEDSEDYDDDGTADWRDEFDSELSASLKLSYAAVVLSFSF